MSAAIEPPQASGPVQFRGVRILFVLASLVVVIAGFKAAKTLILPLMVAMFLSVLCIAPMRRLQRHGVPNGLSIFLVVFGATVVVLLITALMGSSLTQFQEVLPEYRARLDAMVGDGIGWLQNRGLDISKEQLLSKIDTASIMELVGKTMRELLGALSNFFLVVLTMVFMLVEANTLSRKAKLAIGDPDADLSQFTGAVEAVQKYLAIKAMVSGATGLLVTVMLWAFGVDFPFLWGLLAFLFNFVPNIGSIIAAVPAVMLTMLQLGPGTALLIAGGYLIINFGIGNVVEPRLLGRRLGLSTLVVFLSLVFWGWVWGPVGMLLSVPLTVIGKITMEHSEDFRWLAMLLGTGNEPFPDKTSAKVAEG